MICGALLSTSLLIGQGFPLITGQEFEISPQASCQLSEGDFVTVCTSVVDNDGQTELRLSFLRYDVNAEIIVNTIVSDEYLRAINVLATSDGNLLVASEKIISSNNRYPVVMKLSEMGEVIWTKDYPYYEEFEAVDIALLQDDNFVIAATNHDDILFTRNVLMKCSNLGDTIWSEEFVAIENEFARKLRLDEDGTILVVGEAVLDFVSESIGYIRKVDLDGGTTWRYTVQEEDISYAYYDVVANEGLYHLVGHVIQDNVDGYFRVINAQDDVFWSEIYGGEESDSFKSIAYYSNGDFIITGRTKSFNIIGDYDVYALRLSPDFSTEFELTYGGEEQESSGTCLVTQSQDVLISASSRSFNSSANRESYIFVIDTAGSIVTSFEEFDTQSETATIFPNPASIETGFSIVSQSPIKGLEILNLSGELVHSQIIDSSTPSSREISISFNREISAGTYLVRISHHDSVCSALLLLN